MGAYIREINKGGGHRTDFWIGGWLGKYFPWMSILPELIYGGGAWKPHDQEGKSGSHGWASSQDGFDGRECPEEAQGCCVMGKKEVSHDCNTPGTRIGQGYHLINLKGPVSKRDELWECSGRIKPHCECRGSPQKGFSPAPWVFSPFSLTFSTIVLLKS